MHVRDRLTALAFRPHLPRRTVRLRLTVIYGGLFLLSGAALLAITYALVDSQLSRPLRTSGGPASTGTPGGIVRASIASANSLRAQQTTELHQLLVNSGIALGAMLVVSIALGWIVAGRVLRPLRTITKAVQDISATNLDQRLTLDGPDDEIKELGDTFDGLLERLDAAFRSQRQFVANASHELRSPLARQRTVGQVALRDPHATVDSLRAVIERVLAAGRQQERLIEALLTLSRGQAGIDREEPFDLATVVDYVVHSRQEEVERRGLAGHTALSPAPMAGDTRLIECLVVNLVDNALRYNLNHGQVDILTATKAGAAVLSVSNTGPVVPASAVDRLLQPFQRIGRERTGHGKGLGLGLSIVEAIATSHGGTLTLHPQPGGGLEVTVSFPAAKLPAVNQSIINTESGESLPTRSTPPARRAIEPAQPSSAASAR
jgi:signal transduction histidine kinase